MKPKTQNWLDLASGDYRVAKYLFNKKEYLHCLFFCQQAIEKALKAVYYEKYDKTPPRKHDLEVLADAEDRDTLAKNCTRQTTKSIHEQTGEIFEWLKNILK
jgi:HEPN domain-containing protein